jgi:hypothetical protein
MNKIITVIQSVKPDTVGKVYTLRGDRLEKTVVASITEGRGVSREVPDAATFVKLLEFVTESDDYVLCAGEWHNAGQKPFAIMPEETLAKLMGSRVGEVGGGVLDKDGVRVSARLKRGIEPSCWLLLDADNPPGMPPEWAALHIGERLMFWDAMLPGILSCERIQQRGSTARVRREGEPSRPATHAWIRVSDPSKIGLLKAYLGVEMVNRGLSFPFHKLSRSPKTKGKVVGIEHRGLFDLAVFDTGRLVFCARPDVSAAPGYVCDDAGIEIVNPGGGELDLSFLTTPDRAALERYRETTGITLEIKTTPGGGGLSVVSSGQLTRSTEITRRGVTKPLSEWSAGMSVGDKLRCEAPFRESYSEAAFIRIGRSGEPFVYDVGNGTTYHLSEEWPDDPFGGRGHAPLGTPAGDGMAGSPDCAGEASGGAGDDFDAVFSASSAAAGTANATPLPPVPAKTLPLKIRPSDVYIGEYVPADYLIDGLFQTAFLYALTGPTGTGKTALTLLLAWLVANGGKLGERDVVQGNVLFCAGENPDELRQRVIGIADHCFGGWPAGRLHVLTPNVRSGLLTKIGIEQVRAYCEGIGGVRLVIVDTASAFFTGQDENDNVEMGNYARDLRMRLCTLPGGPTVLVPAHPVKKPSSVEDCLPRGGGAFLAEVDGNLALWRQDETISLQIAGKFRGSPFDPIPFRLETVETVSVRDQRGRPVRTVLARLVEAIEVENDAGQARRALEAALLAFTRVNSFASVRDVAVAAGLIGPDDSSRENNTGYQRAKRVVRRLLSQKLISDVADRYSITAAGRKQAKKLVDGGAEDDQF